MNPSPLIRRFARNPLGRDLAVGDIHGYFSRLEQTLNQAGFDPARDRLFSVGDLTDRGPDSTAVLEWLAEPETILPVLHQLTAPGGWLSLAFYNRDALVYRNLLKGHFRKLRSNHLAGEKQSLTPQMPLDPRELATQLQGLWTVQSQSGVRVFHDYMPVEFQARAELLDLLEMELAHRRHPTFAGLGRYLHWICRPA